MAQKKTFSHLKPVATGPILMAYTSATSARTQRYSVSWCEHQHRSTAQTLNGTRAEQRGARTNHPHPLAKRHHPSGCTLVKRHSVLNFSYVCPEPVLVK